MKRVLTAVVLIPVVLTLVFLGPQWQWLFTLGVALIAALAGWEFLGLANHAGATSPRIAVTLCLLVLFAGNTEWPDSTAMLFVVLCLFLLVYCTFLRPVDQIISDAAASIFCLVYIGLTLTALPTLHEQSNGPSLVTFLLCVVWAGDITALYVGRAWGRHKLAPRLSPGKTWEGTIASLAGSVAVAAGLVALSTLLESLNSARLFYPDGYAFWLPIAAGINVAAQAGDLVESALKRSAGVKDSGSLLPGHGGILDRIDALLLAAPVLWYVLVIHQRF